MKQLSSAEQSGLLSAYLDGELNESQVRSLEELLARNPEAKKELEELRALKSLLASKKPIPVSVGFWTRLSAEIERRKADEDNLLPFPRTYVPAVGSGLAIVVLATVFLLFDQRDKVVDYVNQQSERVQQAVENNVLKGSIFPLFSNVDKNQALQFAMFGTLALDAKAETELRVNEDSTKWYTINVNKTGATKTSPVTMREFVDEVRPTRVQLEIIDSLLDLGGRHLEGSVLVAEDRAMAVRPELSRLNKVMLSGIAAALEPEQRTRFNRFLQVRHAPYTLAGGRKTAESKEYILHTMRVPPSTGRFVVVTPDTVVYAGLRVDVDSLRRHVYRGTESRHEVAAHVDGLIRRIGEREVGSVWGGRTPAPQVRVSGDAGVVSIQIQSGWEGVADPQPERWVRSRFPKPPGISSGRARGQSFNFGFSGDDSTFFFNIDIDSVMIQMMKEGGGAGVQIFKGDPRSPEQLFNMDFGRMKQWMDSSAKLAGKKRSSKLDSLMREMEKREWQRDRQRRAPEKPREEQY